MKDLSKEFEDTYRELDRVDSAVKEMARRMKKEGARGDALLATTQADLIALDKQIAKNIAVTGEIYDQLRENAKKLQQIGTSSGQALEACDAVLAKIDQTRRGYEERGRGYVPGIFSLFGGILIGSSLFFMIPTITGNLIGNLTGSKTILGGVLFLLGIVSFIFSLKR